MLGEPEISTQETSLMPRKPISRTDLIFQEKKKSPYGCVEIRQISSEDDVLQGKERFVCAWR